MIPIGLNSLTKCLKPMNNSATQNDRIAKMIFGSVYPLYIAKVEKKGRTKEELDQVIEWLTGFDKKKIQTLANERSHLKHSSKKLRSTRTCILSRDSSVVTVLKAAPPNRVMSSLTSTKSFIGPGNE